VVWSRALAPPPMPVWVSARLSTSDACGLTPRGAHGVLRDAQPYDARKAFHGLAVLRHIARDPVFLDMHGVEHRRQAISRASARLAFSADAPTVRALICFNPWCDVGASVDARREGEGSPDDRHPSETQTPSHGR
jgi:hypothetical protein